MSTADPVTQDVVRQGGWGCDPKLAYKSHMGLLTMGSWLSFDGAGIELDSLERFQLQRG